uniref:Uncharacterized protein n=1 Tax=Triticum urartu TaxID=4572 RepID=A0A8R7QKJ6_TRIUA
HLPMLLHLSRFGITPPDGLHLVVQERDHHHVPHGRGVEPSRYPSGSSTRRRSYFSVHYTGLQEETCPANPRSSPCRSWRWKAAARHGLPPEVELCALGHQGAWDALKRWVDPSPGNF